MKIFLKANLLILIVLLAFFTIGVVADIAPSPQSAVMGVPAFMKPSPPGQPTPAPVIVGVGMAGAQLGAMNFNARIIFLNLKKSLYYDEENFWEFAALEKKANRGALTLFGLRAFQKKLQVEVPFCSERICR